MACHSICTYYTFDTTWVADHCSNNVDKWIMKTLKIASVYWYIKFFSCTWNFCKTCLEWSSFCYIGIQSLLRFLKKFTGSLESLHFGFYFLLLASCYLLWLSSCVMKILSNGFAVISSKCLVFVHYILVHRQIKIAEKTNHNYALIT